MPVVLANAAWPPAQSIKVSSSSTFRDRRPRGMTALCTVCLARLGLPVPAGGIVQSAVGPCGATESDKPLGTGTISRAMKPESNLRRWKGFTEQYRQDVLRKWVGDWLILFPRRSQRAAEISVLRAVDASGRMMRERRQTTLTDAEVRELDSAQKRANAFAQKLWEWIFRCRVEAVGAEVDKRLVYVPAAPRRTFERNGELTILRNELEEVKSTCHLAVWLLGFADVARTPDGKTITFHDELVLGERYDEKQVMDVAVKVAVVARTLGDMKRRSDRATTRGVKPNEATRRLLASVDAIGFRKAQQVAAIKRQIAMIMVDSFNLKFEGRRAVRAANLQQGETVGAKERRSAITGWLKHFDSVARSG